MKKKPLNSAVPELDTSTGTWIPFTASEGEGTPLELSSGYRKAPLTSHTTCLRPSITEQPCGDQAPDGGATGMGLKVAGSWPTFHALWKLSAHTLLWQTWTQVVVAQETPLRLPHCSGDILNLYFKQRTMVEPSTSSAEWKRGGSSTPLIFLVRLT